MPFATLMLPALSRWPKWQMFALSFTALFLELMVIRWVPSVVGLVAYFANLMLLSSFLGLGLGAMLAEKKWNLFAWFPLLLTATIATLLVCRDEVLGASDSELRFYAMTSALSKGLVLGSIFAVNALLFVPLGQRMGVLFNSLPRLTAYGWDLGGSLAGTLVFGFFSLKFFSPVAGMAFVAVIYLLLAERRRVASAALFAVVLVLTYLSGDRAAIWSPYYHLTVSRLETPKRVESAPPPEVRTMRNPPIYVVQVNQFSYHYNATLNLLRYDAGTPAHKFMSWRADNYRLAWDLGLPRDRVLVLGAGGAADLEAALGAGAKHIDAVEIDPAIVAVSRRFNPAGPYHDARVTTHIDDARSFIKKAPPGYDVVIFGYLDSQALFSSMSNVRLDGYVYTVESMRSAFALLNERGTLIVSFGVSMDWLGVKLFRMVAEGTGREPVIYMQGTHMALVVTKDPAMNFPPGVGKFVRAKFEAPVPVDVPTDDWPFLYLQRKTIPTDYLFVIGGLLTVSVATIAGLRRRSFGRSDIHFALLGMGFLLLETKSIGDCTLYFGATWLVTLVVVAGVLLMVIAANLLAERLRAFSPWMYVPLFASLGVLLWVPREEILALGIAGRLAWALLAVPLPVFFAGIIFSTTFRTVAAPSAAFGANLIGAMIGGFCEYLSMAIGNQRLSWLVIVAYLGSWAVLCLRRRNAES